MRPGMDGLLWYCHMPRWSGQEEDAAVAEALLFVLCI